jgi:hypothetical protein
LKVLTFDNYANDVEFDDDYVNVSCLNYDLLVVWIVKLDSAYGVDL